METKKEKKKNAILHYKTQVKIKYQTCAQAGSYA